MFYIDKNKPGSIEPGFCYVYRKKGEIFTMITLATLGSIILGIAIIYGKIQSGEMGCFGWILIGFIILVVLFSLGVTALISMSGY